MNTGNLKPFRPREPDEHTGQVLFVGYWGVVVTYMAFFEYLFQLDLTETQLWLGMSSVMCLPFVLILPFVLHAYRQQMRTIEAVQDTVEAGLEFRGWFPHFLCGVAFVIRGHA